MPASARGQLRALAKPPTIVAVLIAMPALLLCACGEQRAAKSSPSASSARRPGTEALARNPGPAPARSREHEKTTPRRGPSSHPATHSPRSTPAPASAGARAPEHDHARVTEPAPEGSANANANANANAVGSATSPTLAILRRPRAASDTLPAGARTAIRRTNLFDHGGEGSLDGSSARRVKLAGLPSWVLDGVGVDCLMRAAPLPKGGDEYALACVRRVQAGSGYLLSTLGDIAGELGRALVEGVLPDGSSHAELVMRDGRRVRPALRERVYALSAVDPRELVFDIEGHVHRVLIPRFSLPSTPKSNG